MEARKLHASYQFPLPDLKVALQTLDTRCVRGCCRCGLHSGRTQTVFGVGPARPQLVFVGEGPGADEDREGLPFIGKAGQLLTRMIEAMTLKRDDVYICNVVKCRPPGNRTPTEDEMAACSPYLFRQLAILRPKIIVTLGAPASQTLLATKTPIGRLRGAFHDFPTPTHAAYELPPAKLMPTFHPAYLLRSPGEKAKAWHDLQMVMREMGIPTP
ncbi:MAG: uracil-DNA glycosylase [Phycisphaerales bacterium]|nr:uracil-DNA glycosylase [Phycisphaerales bacterium]